MEITGNLATPYIPDLPEGLPRLSVRVTAFIDGHEQFLATCSAQASGSPMPFRVHLDPLSLDGLEQVTLEALCTIGPGAEAVVARATQTLAIADVLQGMPLELNLDAVDAAAQASQKYPVEPLVFGLSGQIVVPPELRVEAAYLDAHLLLIQEDGYSNRYASNLAEHSLYLRNGGAPFSMFLDAASVPEGRQAKLHLGLYDLERTVLLAGNVVKNLDLSSPPDLSNIVLRKPRR